MVLDPIPQSLPVHFFGSRPQPPTSRVDSVQSGHYQYRANNTERYTGHYQYRVQHLVGRVHIWRHYDYVWRPSDSICVDNVFSLFWPLVCAQLDMFVAKETLSWQASSSRSRRDPHMKSLSWTHFPRIETCVHNIFPRTQLDMFVAKETISWPSEFLSL